MSTTVNTTDTWSSITTKGPVTTAEHNYPKRPSWKAYGNGRAVIEMHLAPHWKSIDLRCAEVPEEGRTKEVYVSIPIESLVLLLEKNGYKVLPQDKA